MSTERDELARVIFDSSRNNTQIDLQNDRRLKGSQLAWAGYAADAILAAGYRKPRQVTTVEEVAALPVDSVIAGRPLRLESTVGNIFCVADPELEEQAGLYVMGVDGVQPFDFIYDDLPATVLHEGTL